MAYATTTDLTNAGLPAQSIQPLTAAQISAALQGASDFADTFLRARYTLPLLSWDSSLTEAVAKIAALRLLRIRGYSPTSTADQRFQQGHDEAVAWLNMVQRQQAHPLVVQSASTTTATIAQPTVISTSVVNLVSGRTAGNRGW